MIDEGGIQYRWKTVGSKLDERKIPGVVFLSGDRHLAQEIDLPLALERVRLDQPRRLGRWRWPLLSSPWP